VIGVSVPEDVAREFDDRVLEAASGADQRDSALARVADGGERPVHAPVGARRRDPDAVVGGQTLVPVAGRVRRDRALVLADRAAAAAPGTAPSRR